MQKPLWAEFNDVVMDAAIFNCVGALMPQVIGLDGEGEGFLTITSVLAGYL